MFKFKCFCANVVPSTERQANVLAFNVLLTVFYGNKRKCIWFTFGQVCIYFNLPLFHKNYNSSWKKHCNKTQFWNLHNENKMNVCAARTTLKVAETE